jgi:hypothetical protein
MIPPAVGGNERSMFVRFSTRYFICSPRAVNGRPCPRTCLPRDGAFVIHVMGMERRAGAHSQRALCRPTRNGGQGTKTICGDHRQPECQGRSKTGASIDLQGFDAGKKVVGRKRQILVDTLGLLLGVSVLPAKIQDRDHESLRRSGIPATKNGAKRCSDRALENRDRQKDPK